MRALSFHKMAASGNDFIVIDNRGGRVKNPLRLARELCPIHTSVGADGLLLLEKSRKAAFKMRIINSDGSEAEACGNGFRCIALYGRRFLKLPEKFRFESLSGLIDAQVKKNDRVRVRLVRPRGLDLDGELTVSGSRLHYAFINTGVPHSVIFAEGLEKIDVTGLGRAVRWHQAFKPAGTNVNFVQVRSPSAIEVRTYERGVEAETLACGTGSTASAIVSALMGFTRAPVTVKTRGGEILTVDFKFKGRRVEEVSLEGEARLIFEGKLISA